MTYLWFTVRRKKARRRMRRNGEGRRQYLAHREHARVLIHDRLSYWSRVQGAPYSRVAIRDQSTRWGSCSKRGNLNFNYRLAFLPMHLVDYVIVHELCHLLEFNHSPAFWGHVERTLPDYAACRAELKAIPIGSLTSGFRDTTAA